MTEAIARGDTSLPLLTDTISANLHATVARFPDREALVDVPSGRRWTYTAFSGDVERLARALIARGLSKGDRIGIWAPNVPEWMLTQYAAARVGAVLVTINPAYRSHELRYVLQQAGVRMLIATETFKTSNYRHMIEEVRAECPALEQVVYVATSDWTELIAHAQEVSLTALQARESDLASTDAITIQW